MSKMREARKAKKLTVVKLAILVGLDPSSISRIERGLHGVTPQTAKRIGEVLGIDPAEIIFMERKEEAA
jgi:transcriptional regulator with XRE-family HTH domain